MAITAICFEQMAKFNVFWNSPEFWIIICASVLHWSLQLNWKQNKTKRKSINQSFGPELVHFGFSQPLIQTWRKKTMHLQWIIRPLTSTNCGFCCSCSVHVWSMSTQLRGTLSAEWLMAPIGLQGHAPRRPVPPLLKSHLVGSLRDIDLKESGMRQTEPQLIT